MKFRMPHIFIVLFIVILLAAIATWIVPAGVYDRTEGPGGRLMIVPDTYHTIASSPSKIIDILTAIPRGLVDAGVVVFAVLIVGGAFGVIHATKTIDLGLHRFTQSFKGKEVFMIPVIMTIFALVASFIGTPELSLVYIPIIASLCLTVKWDSMSAVAITLVGVTAGFSTAIISPFSVGIAQQLADVQVGSGIGYRLIVLVGILGSGILYTMRYVKKISNDASLSLTAKEDEGNQVVQTKIMEKANFRHALTGIVLLLGLIVLVYGIVSHGWYLMELSGVFIAIVIVVGIIHKMNLDSVAKEFANGCQTVLVGALVVGFARGVALLLEDGQIMDTVIYSMSSIVETLPSSITAIGMVIVQSIINFVIPSSSGQAVIAMPIMIPLADLVGVGRQTAILAYQLGDGMSNIIFPTSGYFMATLAMARVPYQKWLRFFLPLFGIWLVISAIGVFVAQLIGWN